LIVADSWYRRIRRADALAAEGGPAASLLTFYASVLRSQEAIFSALKRQKPNGTIERDLPLIGTTARVLLREVVRHGPDPLVAEASALLADNQSALDALLMTYWLAPTDRQFFAKAILQPYAQLISEAGMKLADRLPVAMDNRCPLCGGAPQLAVLEASATGVTAVDGGTRRLLCATCLASWPCRRVLCPFCGEENEYKLVYFRSDAFEHLRVDACESCRRYLKSVDLGRLGLAIPLVDEVAGASLDIWARERGYEKIELNLLGL
jgi:FdhE protein